jgi:hypothetical protein
MSALVNWVQVSVSSGSMWRKIGRSVLKAAGSRSVKLFRMVGNSEIVSTQIRVQGREVFIGEASSVGLLERVIKSGRFSVQAISISHEKWRYLTVCQSALPTGIM